MFPSGRYAVLSLVLLAPLQLLAQSDPSNYPNCPIPSQTCVVYGVDFQNGGSYFQNKNSSAQFSFVQQFEGCDMDVAYNMLVDPNGDQTLCGNSQTTPANVDMTSTCPKYKYELSNGLWTIIIISNNGNCAPIAYQRDFTLTAATQKTFTYTPTVYFTNTITNITYQTTTSIYTVTSTAAVPYTTRVPATIRSHTRTITPHAVTTTVTSTRKAVPVTKWTWTVRANVVTETASCTVTPRATKPDPYLTIIPTLPAVAPLASQILNDPAAPIVSAIGGLLGNLEGAFSGLLSDTLRESRSEGRSASQSNGHSEVNPQGRSGGWSGGWLGSQSKGPVKGWSGSWSAKERREFLSAREARFAAQLQKRAPDSATVTVTQMIPSLFVTSSTAVTAPCVVVATQVDITSTQYITPAPVTQVIGASVYRTRTTLAPVTITRTRYVPATIDWMWGTKTLRPTIRVVTTPAAVSSACAKRGGGFQH